ncbi:MAG: diguanylate cyclase, partial [Gammaproteobacteria bacterium]
MGVAGGKLMQPDRLLEELARREHEIEILKETAGLLAGERNLQHLLGLIARKARELVDASTVLIPVLDRECTQYTYMAGDGEHAEEIVGESLPIEFGICGWVWKHKRPWWRGVLDELDEHERTRWEAEAGTVLLVPLIGKEHFLGGVSALHKRTGGDFTRRDLDLLTLFASQAALAIENAMAFERLDEALRKSEDLRVELLRLNADLLESNRQLEYMSLYDPVTRLPNRALFHDRLRSLCKFGEDGGGDRAVALVMLDVLHFHEVNERWGNEAGDALLREIAERLRARARKGDTVARYGADEFVFLRPGIDAAAAVALAEELLQVLAEPFSWG